jgi:large subunit ribosomal protein L35
MKSNRGAAKRFKATGGGNVRRNKAFARHILTTNTTTQKRRLRSASTVDSANIKAVRKLLPYLG